LLNEGGLLSFGSLVGFVAVLGIAVRNVITLVTRYRDLEEREGRTFGLDLLERGTREGAAPILMTAVTTALVFLPLLLFRHVAGLEIAQPAAIVVLGGLVTTTLLTLVGVPAMYLLFGGKREADLELSITAVTDQRVRSAVAGTSQ
jgi:Cu/Ag efflux pump CusA